MFLGFDGQCSLFKLLLRVLFILLLATCYQEKGDGGVISQVANAASETAQQATQILQQTGVQVKNMALGAADAVRNTLGMNESNPTTTVNTTSSNTNAANSPATAGGAANPTTTTPGGANRLDLK